MVYDAFVEEAMRALHELAYDPNRKLGCLPPPHNVEQGFYGIFDRHDAEEGVRYTDLVNKGQGGDYPRSMALVPGGIETCTKYGFDIWYMIQSLIGLLPQGKYFSSMCEPGEFAIIRSVMPPTTAVLPAVVQYLHTDLDPKAEIWREDETPLSVVIPVEREGCHLWIKPESTFLNRTTKTKKPLVKVSVPYGGLIMFRGDAPHGGGFYETENRRIFLSIRLGDDNVEYAHDTTYPCDKGKGYTTQEEAQTLLAASEEYLSQMTEYTLGRKEERRR